MTLYEITTPDGRHIRQRHQSLDRLKADLLPGYTVIGTVSLANEDDAGGFVAPFAGPTLMGALLAAHGDELLAWLKGRI